MNKTILIAILIFTCVSCKEKVEEKITLRPVTYEKVDFLDWENSRVFTGTSRANEVINLSFRNSGIITLFNLKLGQKVEKGDLLAKLDNVQARLNYESALSSMNSAASQMNTSKLNLDRVRALYEKGSSSLSDYENAKNSFLTAKGSYEASQRSVDIQQEQITYGFLYAPTDGRISNISAEINENMSAGQIVAVLNADGRKEISLGIPESVINEIKLKESVAVKFTSLADNTYTGVITEVAPSIDINTATYPVKVALEGDTQDVRSGMSASVTFNFETSAEEKLDIIGVPTTAVGEDSKGNFVFHLVDVKDNTATAKKKYVTIGNMHSNGFEIQKGLKRGDLILTAGLQTILNDQQVKLTK
jgi:RND family efflux transporter MFP subunit